MNKKQLEAKKKFYETFKDSVDYIQEYNNTLSKEECEMMIDLFKNLKKKGLGGEGQVTKSLSQSLELESNLREDDKSYEKKESKESYDVYLDPSYLHRNEKIKKIYKKINYCITDYLLKVGTLSSDFIGMSLEEFSVFAKRNNIKMGKHRAKQFEICTICLREYPKKTGGYHSMHCDVNHNAVLRIAAGVLYLNTIKEGGETKFPVLGRKVKPVAGKFAIFPPYYTHMHYGEISEKENRYVIVVHIIHSNVKAIITKEGE